MLQGTDGAYYGIINIAGDSDAQPSGNCPFRTNSPTNPQSYRGWDGEAFTVQWHSAYTTSTATANAVNANHTRGRSGDAVIKSGKCAVLSTNYSTAYSEHVNFRRIVAPAAAAAAAAALHPTTATRKWPSFAVIGTGRGTPSQGEIRYSFSYETDFAKALTAGDWTTPQYLNLNVGRWLGSGNKVLYPTVLDESSPALGQQHLHLHQPPPTTAATAAAAAFRTRMVVKEGGASVGTRADTASTILQEDGNNYMLLGNESAELYVVTAGANVRVLRACVCVCVYICVYTYTSILSSPTPLFWLYRPLAGLLTRPLFDGAMLAFCFVILENKARNILKRKIYFDFHDAPPSPPQPPQPRPPPPPLVPGIPLSCSAISVTGAGTAEINGIYRKTANPTLPLFYSKEGSSNDTYQLYQWNGVSKFAHLGVAGSQLYTNMYSNTSTIPCDGWRLSGGKAPAPAILSCADSLDQRREA